MGLLPFHLQWVEEGKVKGHECPQYVLFVFRQSRGFFSKPSWKSFFCEQDRSGGKDAHEPKPQDHWGQSAMTKS
jgi:hypothetical protein